MELPVDKDEPGEEEADFYWENGLIVFTAKYHLKRGHCCKNGCRHCPYGFVKQGTGEDGSKSAREN